MSGIKPSTPNQPAPAPPSRPVVPDARPPDAYSSLEAICGLIPKVSPYIDPFAASLCSAAAREIENKCEAAVGSTNRLISSPQLCASTLKPFNAIVGYLPAQLQGLATQMKADQWEQTLCSQLQGTAAALEPSPRVFCQAVGGMLAAKALETIILAPPRM